jgi:hypothetical protein
MGRKYYGSAHVKSSNGSRSYLVWQLDNVHLYLGGVKSVVGKNLSRPPRFREYIETIGESSKATQRDHDTILLWENESPPGM